MTCRASSGQRYRCSAAGGRLEAQSPHWRITEVLDHVACVRVAVSLRVVPTFEEGVLSALTAASRASPSRLLDELESCLDDFTRSGVESTVGVQRHRYDRPQKFG